MGIARPSAGSGEHDVRVGIQKVGRPLRATTTVPFASMCIVPNVKVMRQIAQLGLVASIVELVLSNVGCCYASAPVW